MPDRRSTVPLIALAILALIALSFQVSVSWELLDAQLHVTTRARTPFAVAIPAGTLEGLEPEATEAGLQEGFKPISLDGRPARGFGSAFEAVRGKHAGDTLQVVAERPGGTISATVKLRGENAISTRAWVANAFLKYLTPWFCLLLGFAVAFLRPRDPLAWLLLALLLSFASISQGDAAGAVILGWSGWTRRLATFWLPLWSSTWGLWMMLFGQYFPDRQSNRTFDRIARWVLGLPLLVLAPLTAVLGVLSSEDVTAWASLQLFARRFAGVFMALSMMAIGTFFMNISMKMFRSQGDARRRLRLLYGGASIALTPLFLLVLWSLIRRTDMGNVPEWILIPSLVALFLFPLTLAYVIVVEKAMDLKVALRQGLQYALATGGVRALQVIVSAIALTVAVRMASDPSLRRPQQMEFLAFGFLFVMLLRRVALKLKGWVDRRFFREAVNLERVLGDLSEQVRGIVETGPLLETVTGSISSSLHVPRVTAWLPSNGDFAPVRSTGQAPPPVKFPRSGALADELHRTRHALRISQVNPEPWMELERERLETVSAELLLPLTVKDRLLGFLSLGPKLSEEPYSATDVRLLQSVASQTGLALENSRLTEAVASEVAQRERLNRELEIAREVQERLFPQSGPKIAGLDYAGGCRPASSVGGDYYDFVPTCDGRLGIAIGDISGKGIPAALLMASLQASLRGLAISNPPALAVMMTNLNRLIYDTSPSNRYATFFYSVFNPKNRELMYVNGGHNPPMVFRGGSEVIRLEEGGPVVGLFGPAEYDQAIVTLQPGDLVLMFTDGVSEAMNAAEDEFGEEQMMAAVQAQPNLNPTEMIAHLMRAADEFAAGAPQHDDMTLVVVRIE